MNNTPENQSNDQRPALSNHCYAESIRRWNFTTRGGEIWVCEGDHEKCDACERHEREVFSAEAVKIIEALKSEALRLALHNDKAEAPSLSEVDPPAAG